MNLKWTILPKSLVKMMDFRCSEWHLRKYQYFKYSNGGIRSRICLFLIWESTSGESGDNSPCLITMNKFFHTGTLVAHHLSQRSDWIKCCVRPKVKSILNEQMDGGCVSPVDTQFGPVHHYKTHTIEIVIYLKQVCSLCVKSIDVDKQWLVWLVC